MIVTPPPTTHMGISDARAKLTSVINEVYRGETRVVVENSGIPVAAVVSPSDRERWERHDRNRDADWACVDETASRFADVSEEELIERALETIAEVRASPATRADLLAK